MAATISAIYTCARAGAPMQSHGHIAVVAGEGLAGDRYAKGIGVYSRVEPIKVRHATLITQDGIDTANAMLRARGLVEFSAADTRRNLVVAGMQAEELNDLVGREFSFGGIRFRGIEFSDPCHRPGRLLDRSGFEQAFERRGGLRAEVFSSGELIVGAIYSLERES